MTTEKAFIDTKTIFGTVQKVPVASNAVPLGHPDVETGWQVILLAPGAKYLTKFCAQ